MKMRNKIEVPGFVAKCLAICFYLCSVSVSAQSVEKENILLRSYEPNTLGYSFDDNDVAYMDFKLSLKYPILHGVVNWTNQYVKILPMPYFAFSGRFGQYIGTRNSSPVIGKRFNPKVFFRYSYSDADTLDFAYAHESNGQKIDNEQVFQEFQNDLVAQGEQARFANDYISRGWDYLQVVFKNEYNQKAVYKFSSYVDLKYFLKTGAFQGGLEEYNSWENSTIGKTRSQVDGVSLLLKYKYGRRYEIPLFGEEYIPFNGVKFAAMFTTGYKDTLSYRTYRVEATTIFWDLPIMFWYSRGYNSDLVDYYKDVTSYGISFELKTFIDEV